VTVVEGTQVRINVSSGPKPISVPSVIGVQYTDAASQLEKAGFQVSRVDVDSELEKGEVVDQTPNGGDTAAKGSTVTLSVSKGAATAAVPDVTSFQLSDAEAALRAAGFKWQVVLEDTTDPTLDGFVISQDPAGGSQAKPGSSVTLFVGRFTGSDSTTSTTTTPTAPTP
jgi:eukaryotic-like serine/threonine-protein kinase